MDIIFITLSVVFLLVGIVGVIVPVIPGVPLCWFGLLMLKLAPSFRDEISWTILIVLGIIVLGVSVLDNLLPLWGTKQMGGNKTVVWGATIGLIVGLFFGLLGIIFGPFLGAFIGELIHTRADGKKSIKAAFGAFLAFIVGTGAKMITSSIMLFFAFRPIISAVREFFRALFSS